jgi:hypothetical protein
MIASFDDNHVPDTRKKENGMFLLCVPAGWETYISREFHELQEGLSTRGWTKLVIGETSDTAIVAAIRQAKVVLLWEAYELLERNAEVLNNGSADNIRRIVFCDDVHHFTSHRRQQRLRTFLWADIILATYPDKLHQWYPEVHEQKIKWMPHSAASYFQPIFSPSSDRVLLSGSRTWPYPFRQFCQAKLPDTVCDVIDHPGYPGYPGDKANNMKADSAAMTRLGGERYAALLKQYPGMLVCGSIFGYLVAKVFEGMAAGCLVICERSSLAQRLSALGFIEGEHYIGTDLLNVIEDTTAVRDMFLRSDPRWAIITANASRKVSEQHTTKKRAEQIHRTCIESVGL